MLKMLSKGNVLEITKEPLAGNNLTNLIRLVIQNRFRIGFRYIPRMIYAFVISTAMAPFFIIEKIRFDKEIKRTEIKPDPIFIIGHWRSGTTYLHNLMSLDKNLGFFSTFHAYVPGVFLGSEKIFKPILVNSLPEKRPMDDVIMDADFPHEDEYALGAFSPYSYYHGWCFPKNMNFYNKFVLMDDIPGKAIKEWNKVYVYLLKKVTFFRGGKRLLVKNPANTAKIKLLVEMFPGAKFIFLYRNPYHLYFSMMKFMKRVIPLYCLQKPPKIDEVEKIMIELYKLIFTKYLDEKRYISEGKLLEVKYEDFIKRPLEELKRIYKKLNIEGFKDSEQSFREYIASQSSFKTDKYEINNDIKRKIYLEWKLTFESFGYQK
jgi:hypothetical protein